MRAVHIAARILGVAQPGEVLVSTTVRDLLAGSGLAFEDRGEYELKGIEAAEAWQRSYGKASKQPTLVRRGCTLRSADMLKPVRTAG